jgi:hypothetical protein
MLDGPDRSRPQYSSTRHGNQMQKDRRRYGRRPIHNPALAWVPNAVVEADEIGRQPIIIRDVSLEGARFEATMALAVPSEITLHLRLKGRDLSIPCETTYVRTMGFSVGERQYIYGCRFLFISPRDAQMLADADYLG